MRMIPIIISLIALSQVVKAQDNGEVYNIMTMDGGGIRGIVTSECIRHIEKAAYDYARENPNIFKKVPVVHYPNGTVRESIHMMWLFDMFSGTSTGSLLSTALAVKSDGTNIHKDDDYKGLAEPQYWADECTEIYATGAPDIFRDNSLGKFGRWVFYLSFITVLGAVFYCWGRCRYDSKAKIEAFDSVEDFLKESMERIRQEREQEKLILAKLASNIKDIRKGVAAEEEEKAMAVNNPLKAS